VYRSQAKAKEALAILDDDRVGINSHIGKQAWELVRHKVDFLGEGGRWEQQWWYCHALLVDARPSATRDDANSARLTFGKVGDDWKIWSNLIKATHQIGKEE